MNYSAKQVLFIDLSRKKFEVKSFPELTPYLGGVGIGTRLYDMYTAKDPVIFSVGPLNGLYPYVSKTSIVLAQDGTVEDAYLGGSLSFRITFAGLDAIAVLGVSPEPVVINIYENSVEFRFDAPDINSLGLPGKRSVLRSDGDEMLLDNYFITPQKLLAKKLQTKQVSALVITGSKLYDIPNVEKYSQLYRTLLARTNEVEERLSIFPSCSGCPIGCEHSKIGEMGGNIFGHCLVACDYAKKIYSDINVVFSCLNVLGYDYTHEDLEKVPKLVSKVLGNV